MAGAAKIHKEGQVFKKVFTWDKFGDHVDEVHFPRPVCLTGLKIGAVPTAGSFIHVFAHDLDTRGSARFACLAEQCALPDTSVKAVRVEATITDHVSVRGCYKSLPIALYGWTLAYTPSQAEESVDADDDDGFVFQPDQTMPEAPFLAADTPGTPGVLPSTVLPPFAESAINAVLPAWSAVGMSPRQMHSSPLPEQHVQDLLKAADRFQSMLALSPLAARDAADAAHKDWLTTAVKAEAGMEVGDRQVAAAELAAGWSRAAAADSPLLATGSHAMAGLAASVLVCSSPGHMEHFIRAGGVQALSAVLEGTEAQPALVRLAVAALDCLTRCGGAAACEAALGWWAPAEAEQALDATADAQASDEPAAEDKPALANGQDVQDVAMQEAPDVKPEETQPAQPVDADAPVVAEEDAPPAAAAAADATAPVPPIKVSVKAEKIEVASGSSAAAEAEQPKEGPADPAEEEQPASSKRKSSKEGKKEKHKHKSKDRSKDGKRDRRDSDTPKASSQQQDADPPAKAGQEAPASAEAAPAEGDRTAAAAAAEDKAAAEAKSASDASAARNRKRRWDTGGQSSRDADEGKDARASAEGKRSREEPEPARRDRDRSRERGREREGDRDHERSRDRDRDRARSDRHGRDRDREPDRHDRARDRSDRDRDRRSRGERDDSDRRTRGSSAERPADSRARRPVPGIDYEELEKRRAADGLPPLHLNSRSPQGNQGGRKSGHAEEASHEHASLSGGSAAAAASEDEEEHTNLGELGIDENFQGCFSQLAQTLLQPLPEKVVRSGARVLGRLTAYGAAARFQASAEAAVRAVAGGESSLSTAELQGLISHASGALSSLSAALAACRPGQGGSSDRAPPVIGAFAAEGLRLQPPAELEACVAEGLAARRCLPLLAALLHVPALHAAEMEDASSLPASAPTALALQAMLAAPVLSGVQRLLTVLLSDSVGLALLAHNGPVAAALLAALDPANAGEGGFGLDASPSSRGAGAEVAATVRTALAAHAVGRMLAQLPPGGRGDSEAALGAAMRDMAGAATLDVGARPVTGALLCVPGAVEGLLRIIQEPIAEAIESAAAVEAGTARPVPVWRPAALYAAALLAEVTRDSHPDALARCTPLAARIKEAIQHALDSPLVQQPGAEAAKRLLREARGRTDAMTALAVEGPSGLLQVLDALLPSLTVPDERGRKRIKDVDAKASAQLVHTGEKLGTVETGLHLLHALLGPHPLAPAAIFAVTQANGVQIAERAVRTAAAALAASNNDSAWSAFAGDALDDAICAGNRTRAAQLLSSAASAASSLLQRLAARGTELNSGAVMAAVLKAHGLCTNAPECLAALMGRCRGPVAGALMQARQKLAAALKCWVDNDTWTPELIPAVFAAGHHVPPEGPLIMALAPSDMLSTLSVLGDVFPAEWPPPGTAKARGSAAQPHPPPGQMGYRARLARSMEPSARQFTTLVSTAAASDCALVRAALVRLCGRASGLGGGMGLFLAQPIAQELALAVAPTSPLAHARRLLTLLVPLAYRPAIKAALLDLHCTSQVSRLLARLVPVLSSGGGPEAAALATMALEVATVLVNPDCCLNPQAPAGTRATTDCPPLSEAGELMGILLGALPRLGMNALLVRRMVSALASRAKGRAALRLGVAQWQRKAGGGSGADADAKAALQWAVSHLWQLSQDGSTDAGVRSACMGVANALEEVATAADEGDDDPSGTGDEAQIPAAPQRFASAVQASLTAAQSAGIDVAASTQSELADSASATVLVFDAAAQMFWKNMEARSFPESMPPMGRNPISWDLPADVASEVVTKSLGEGLTRRKRPRDASMGGSMAARDATLSGAGEAGRASATEDAAKSAPAAAAAKPAADLPGADLPPVLAPPGRSRGAGRGRMASTGRPASMHVDDYERPAASTATPPPPPKPPAASPHQPPTASPAGTPSLAAGRGPSGLALGGGMDIVLPGKGSAGGSGSQAGGGRASMTAKGVEQELQALKNPSGQQAAFAELAKDPVKLQRVLEANPQLMTALQSKLGSRT